MNILLTSIGRRDYLVRYFKDGMNPNDKLFVSNSLSCSAFTLADGHTITPLIYEDNYISFIVDYCIENNIKAVMSVFDIDLMILAKNRLEFTKVGIELILAPAEFVEICNDKWKTFTVLRDMGIKTPVSYIHLDDVKAALASGELNYPIMMKPRWGMGSIGVYKIHDDQELEVLTNRCLREIASSHLKYESAVTPDAQLIYQEFLEGQEHGIDVISDLKGNYVGTYVKKKIAMRSGETDLGKTVSNSDFVDIATKIAEISKHQAILSVDVFMTEKGVYVTEMNCRISGHYPLSHLAGVDLPRQIVKWLNGEKTDMSLMQFKEGIMITKTLVPTILE